MQLNIWAIQLRSINGFDVDESDGFKNVSHNLYSQTIINTVHINRCSCIEFKNKLAARVE